MGKIISYKAVSECAGALCEFSVNIKLGPFHDENETETLAILGWVWFSDPRFQTSVECKCHSGPPINVWEV